MNNSVDLIEAEQEGLFKETLSQIGEVFTWLANAPRCIKATTFVLSALLIIEGAHLSSTGLGLYQSVTSPAQYGPGLKSGFKNQSHYSFHQVGRSFYGNLPLWRLSEISSDQLAALFLASVPRSLEPRLKKYIHLAFTYAEKYKVDPLWVVSIMWVESHFDPKVQSSVKATGLMQIMPGTSQYLNRLMKRKLDKKLASELTKDPKHNVQLGVFYLKRLLKSFRGSYVYATVAYNMGPGYTRRRLRRSLPVGTRNEYLDKVRRAYNHFNRKISAHLKINKARYMDTFVVGLSHKENQYFPGSLSFFWDKITVEWDKELVQNKLGVQKSSDFI